MFTGIVEELGNIERINADQYVFRSPLVLEDVELGASIAVNGCCLTVVEHDSTSWTADISGETRKRTTFDRMVTGQAVNFERPVRLQDRLGGHLVQGHVDGTGVVLEPGAALRVELPEPLLKYVVEKGSIAVDGVSLTIVEVFDNGFSVALIPHTLSATNLGALTKGDTVNIEVDVMAKYAERLLAFKDSAQPPV